MQTKGFYKVAEPRGEFQNSYASFSVKAIASKTFHNPSDPWSADRYARCLVGVSVLACLFIGYFLHWLGFIGLVMLSLNLVVTSFTGNCAFHKLLLKMGAKDREDLFEQGGKVRETIKKGDCHDK